MNNKKNWLIEDEDDIFHGTPKSKFFDIVKHSSKEIVEDELDKIFEKYAAMEFLLSQDKEIDFDINKELKNCIFNNSEKIDEIKKGLYLEFTGDIVCRLDS